MQLLTLGWQKLGKSFFFFIKLQQCPPLVSAENCCSVTPHLLMLPRTRLLLLDIGVILLMEPEPLVAGTLLSMPNSQLLQQSKLCSPAESINSPPTRRPASAVQQVRTKQEEVDHKEEVLAVLLERYAASSGAPGDAPLGGRSHPNLGALGITRQGSLTALSKASLATTTTDTKASPARPTPGDVKRMGSSRGRLDIKVTPFYCMKARFVSDHA